MNVRRLIGALLIAAGVLALVHGGFEYTRKTRKVDIGVAELKLDQKERIKVPTWAGVAAIVAGAALLAIGRR